MAFEAFLAQDQVRPRRRRRLTYAISLIVHGALLALGIAYSFWHVEEISPPTVRVTFMSSAPPPPAPPPPPPAGGGGEAKKKITPRIKPTPNQLVQPRTIQPKREEPKVDPAEHPQSHDDDDDDRDHGIAGGTKGGTIGGTVGGTIGGTIGGTVGGGAPAALAPPPAKLLPPQMGARQKLSGDDPDFPAVLRRSGLVYLVMAKICVSKGGQVDSVAIIKGADPLLEKNVVSAVKGWRYRPLMANSLAVPFCYPGVFEFRSS
jgi:protein TonB